MLLYADDASRVILSVPDARGSDYINASYIDVRIDIYTSKCIYVNDSNNQCQHGIIRQFYIASVHGILVKVSLNSLSCESH